jgi:hypothetical protein
MDCPQLLNEGATSFKPQRDTKGIGGFCDQYSLRRHKHEDKADQGCLQLRDDWQTYIGPIERWGSCNPFEGNFGSVVLPMCKPDRLALVCYIFECKQLIMILKLGPREVTHILFSDAFLYDNVLESVSKAQVRDSSSRTQTPKN